MCVYPEAVEILFDIFSLEARRNGLQKGGKRISSFVNPIDSDLALFQSRETCRNKHAVGNEIKKKKSNFYLSQLDLNVKQYTSSPLAFHHLSFSLARSSQRGV